MNNPTSTQWEQAILNKLTSNGERIAVVERDLSEIKNRLTGIESVLGDVRDTNQKIESLLGWLKWIGGGVVAILLSIIANFLYSFFA